MQRQRLACSHSSIMCSSGSVGYCVLSAWQTMRKPEVQYPHWKALASIKAYCSGESPKPTTDSSLRPWASTASTRQDFTG